MQQNAGKKFVNAAIVERFPWRSPYILMVEHAGNYIPRTYKDLGVDKAVLETHRAYDIGILPVTQGIMKNRGAEVMVACPYSRLLIDPNRPKGHEQLIPEQSDHVDIPGNIGISEEERKIRIEGIYDVYHAAAHAAVSRKIFEGQDCFVIGMHSATKQLTGGPERPWHIGFSTYGDDDVMKAFAEPFIKKGYTVGLHEPYNMKGFDGTSLDIHAHQRGLPHILVEIRQDLIEDLKGQRLWAGLMTEAMKEFAPTIPSLFQVSRQPDRPAPPSP